MKKLGLGAAGLGAIGLTPATSQLKIRRKGIFENNNQLIGQKNNKTKISDLTANKIQAKEELRIPNQKNTNNENQIWVEYSSNSTKMQVKINGTTRTITKNYKLPSNTVSHFDSQDSGSIVESGGTVSEVKDKEGSFKVTGDASLGQINGETALEFNGSNQNLTNNDNSNSISKPYSIVIVWQYLRSDTTTNDIVFDSYGDHQRKVRTGYYGDNAIHSDSPDNNDTQIVGSKTQTDKVYLTIGIYDGSNSVLYENKNQTGTGTLKDIGLNGYTLGSAGGNTAYLQGRIGEIVVINGRISSSEISSEETRLNEKWNLGL